MILPEDSIFLKPYDNDHWTQSMKRLIAYLRSGLGILESVFLADLG